MRHAVVVVPTQARATTFIYDRIRVVTCPAKTQGTRQYADRAHTKGRRYDPYFQNARTDAAGDL